MGIIKNTLQKQINDKNIQQINDTTATIIEYNHVNNTAKIRYLNPYGEGVLYRDNVAVANTLGGVIGSGIYPGQTCNITFIRNNIHTPVIVGLTGSNYSSKTCSDQGAFIVDSSLLSLGKPEDISPMVNDWIEEGNTNPAKYNNDLGDYTAIDSSEAVHEFLNTLDKYKATEQGITSLDTKSTVKLKDNGDIDMFVANNIGIRICPNNKTIEFYGFKFLFNGTELDEFSVRNGESSVENISISDIMKVSEIQKLFASIDSNLSELKLCIQYTIDLTGNANKFAALEAQIKAYEKLKDEYNNNLETASSVFINDTYTALVKYNETFDKELKDAAGILEV